MSIANTYTKPLVAAVVAGALDNLVCGQTNVQRNAMFGASVGAGIFAASLATSMIPDISFLSMPDYGIDGKTVGVRVVEIGLGTGAAFVLSQYVLKTGDFAGSNLTKKIGIVFAADFIGEYAQDYLTTQPLSFFA
jgi:hypothetical protein